jgi:hypothetical protein
MGFAKKKEKTLQDLADDIRRVRAEISEFIDDRVAELKASSSGKSLPIGWLRHELTKFECPCEVALRLIDNG